MHLSRRILNVKSSPTVALNAKAKALAKDGIKVLNFAVGEPDFPTPQAVVDVAIRALQAGRTKYGPAGGSLEFREAIVAKLARENGLDFRASDVVVGMGAKEVLFHIFLALLNEGDEVLIPTPYWVSYPDQIIAAGGRPVCLPLPQDIGSEPLTPQALEKAATSRTTAVVLNSPNNPAGYAVDEKSLRELGRYLVDKPWWIISDEIYEYLSFDRPHVSLLKLFPELRERFILVNGMSKGFAMTGWRVGYCAGPASDPARPERDVVRLVRDLQSHSSTCLPPFIEEAATFAISQGPKLLAEGLETMRRRRDLAVARLRDLPEVSFVTPQGAFYVFVDVRDALRKAAGRSDAPQDTLRFCERLLLQDHIAVVPGDAFGAPGFLRFSYATDEASIEEGLRRFAKAVRAL